MVTNVYIIELHRAELGFLAVAPLFCVVRRSRGVDGRRSGCSSVLYCLSLSLFFVGEGVEWSVVYGGVVCYLRII
jgi:hypothetical protein